MAAPVASTPAHVAYRDVPIAAVDTDGETVVVSEAYLDEYECRRLATWLRSVAAKMAHERRTRERAKP